MRLVFALFKFFPFGGLQKDMLSIASACVSRGHPVTVYCREWQGEEPDFVNVQRLPVKGLSNHSLERRFVEALTETLKHTPHDLVVGFNKMPGLDCYYAADSCYVAKVLEERSVFSRLTPRFRLYRDFEQAVFGGTTEALMISVNEIPVFQHYYGTPDCQFHLLPPGIKRDRVMPPDYQHQRAVFRDQWQLAADDKLVLLIGSGFRTKGLDRALEAIAALPDEQRAHTRLFVVGADKSVVFETQARRLGIERRVEFLQGRDDIPRFLWGGDLLIHPAYRENTGTVLLEAMVAGLPVLTTDVCGYAHYVSDHDMGAVMPLPFDQRALNEKLAELLRQPGDVWRRRGAEFAATADIYAMPERAAELIVALGENRAVITA